MTPTNPLARAYSILPVVMIAVVHLPPAHGQVLPPVPIPDGNPITIEKAALGKALFWEEQLSSSRTVACGTCHIPTSGGVDPRSFSKSAEHPGPDFLFGSDDDIRGTIGLVSRAESGHYQKEAPFPLRAQVTSRSAPSMINAAYSPDLLWDGRAEESFVDPLSGSVVLDQDAALESQALEPILSEVEMAHADRDWPQVVAQLAVAAPLALASDVPPALDDWIGARSYPDLFQEVFGSSGITPVRIAMAIATYQRTLISDQSPFDDFNAGDSGALTSLQKQGMVLFLSQVTNCTSCHSGPLFTNQNFRNIGVRPNDEDTGQFAITGNPNHIGRFRVPSLRNVALRAPYFHNGGPSTLAEVVDFYDRGGDFHENQANQVVPLNLSDGQKASLVAFLEALTDPRVAAGLSPFDRPTLFSERDVVPSAYGNGLAGTGGFTPRMLVIDPPVIGNPAFSFAVAEGMGGAAAFLGIDAAASSRVDSSFPIHLAGTAAMILLPLGPLTGDGAGEGWQSLTISIPTNPSLAGASAFMQAFVIDPGASGGIAATSGVEIPMFAPKVASGS